MSPGLRTLAPLKAVTTSAFDPTTFSALQGFWWNSYVNSSGLTTWNDLSANGRNVSYTAKPVVTANDAAINNQPSFAYASTKYGDYGSSNIASLGTAFSFYSVLKMTVTPAVSNFPVVMSVRVGATNINIAFVCCTQAAWPDFWCGFSNGTLGWGFDNATLRAGGYVSIIASYNGAGANGVSPTNNWTYWMNGVSQTAIVTGGTISNSDLKNYVGAYANTSPPAFPFDGSIATIAIRNAAASGTDVTNWQSWVATQFGI